MFLNNVETESLLFAWGGLTQRNPQKNVASVHWQHCSFVFCDPRTVFKLNYSASDSADKNGVKNRLKKFISRRPSMKTLQEKGIIKGELLYFNILVWEGTSALCRFRKWMSKICCKTLIHLTTLRTNHHRPVNSYNYMLHNYWLHIAWWHLNGWS